MLFLKQSLILACICHKSATTCQVDSNKVSNSKLKLDLCNCVKAGFHLCKFCRTIARPVVWACVVRFTEEDSPVFGVRATDFGSWIDFNFSATSTNRANQIAFILQ